MTLNVAVIGAGIGQKHVDAYLRLREHFELRSICDLDLNKATSLAAQASDCTATCVISDVMNDPAVDIVDICLPPHLHGSTTLAALAAGKHVICEKPITTSVIEADCVSAAARKADRLFVPILQYRYGHALYQLSLLQKLGLTGRPLVATLETHWQRDAEYYAVNWRGTWAGEGGGAVLIHAIHLHDLVTQYFGPISSVSAALDTRANAIETEDCAALSMVTASGGLVTSSVTLGAAGDVSRIRLVFDGLTAQSFADNPYAPGESTWTFTATDPTRQREIDSALAEKAHEINDRHQGYAGLFEAVAQALAAKDHELVTAEDGVRTIELVAAIYLSAGNGQRIELPLDRSLPICKNWKPDQ